VLQKVYPCVENKVFQSEDCNDLKQYVIKSTGHEKDKNFVITTEMLNHFLVDHKVVVDESFDISKKPTAQITIDTLRERILFYAKKELELRQSPIPIIGSIIDINDIWVVSAVIMSFLLYFLDKSYQQEIRNAMFVKLYHRRYFNIIKTNQVLAHFSDHKSVFVGLLRIIVFALPSIFQMWLLYENLKTFSVAGLLVSEFENYLEYFFELASSVMLFIVNIQVWRSHEKLERIFVDRRSKKSIKISTLAQRLRSRRRGKEDPKYGI